MTHLRLIHDADRAAPRARATARAAAVPAPRFGPALGLGAMLVLAATAWGHAEQAAGAPGFLPAFDSVAEAAAAVAAQAGCGAMALAALAEPESWAAPPRHAAERAFARCQKRRGAA